MTCIWMSDGDRILGRYVANEGKLGRYEGDMMGEWLIQVRMRDIGLEVQIRRVNLIPIAHAGMMMNGT